MHPAQHYKMFRSGATSSGHQGSQIWLAHKLASYVVATRALSPRVVAVCLNVSDLEVFLVSAHASIEGSDEHGEFWSQLENLLMSFHDPPKLRVTIVGIDSNGKVGACPSKAIGPEEPDQENSNGFGLRSVMDCSDLCLLNTFVPMPYMDRVSRSSIQN